jgi:erythromycin esterase-like protein
MRERRHSYVADSTLAQYDWAYRSAHGAAQVDAWLRPIPLGWKPEDGFAWAEKSLIPRHQAMVDNLDWILKQLRNGQRILLFSALSHVATTTLQLSDAAGPQFPAGIDFKRRFGSRMVTIGNIVSDGQIGNCRGGPKIELKSPPESSLSHLLGKLGISEFILDLRQPPRGATAYLSGPHELWNGFATMSLDVPKAFDIAHFAGPLVPACSIVGIPGIDHVDAHI